MSALKPEVPPSSTSSTCPYFSHIHLYRFVQALQKAAHPVKPGSRQAARA